MFGELLGGLFRLGVDLPVTIVGEIAKGVTGPIPLVGGIVEAVADGAEHATEGIAEALEDIDEGL